MISTFIVKARIQQFMLASLEAKNKVVILRVDLYLKLMQDQLFSRESRVHLNVPDTRNGRNAS